MKALVRLLPLALLLSMSACQLIVIEEEVFDQRDAFIGRYEVDEFSSTLGISTLFTMDVYKDSFEPNLVVFENFYGAGLEVFGEVSGRKVRIPLQQVGFYEVEGIGTINGRELTLSYTVTDVDGNSIFVDDLHAIAWRF